jgi:hypothetical protein
MDSPEEGIIEAPPKKNLLFHAKLGSLTAALGMAAAKAAVCQPGRRCHGGLARNRFLSRCAGVKRLPNKISGRRPLFLM